MSFKFNQIQPLVSMVTDRMGKRCLPCFSAVFHPFLFIRHVMMTCKRARKSSNFGLIRPPIAELAALERLKKTPHRLIMGKTMSSIFLCCS